MTENVEKQAQERVYKSRKRKQPKKKNSLGQKLERMKSFLRERGEKKKAGSGEGMEAGGAQKPRSTFRSFFARYGKFGRRELLILLLPVAAAVVAVLVLTLAGRDALSLRLTGQPCRYYAGSSYPIEPGSTLRRTAEGKTVLEEKAGTRELDSLPIYFADKGSIVLPQDMIYYTPRNDTCGRLEFFSELSINEYGEVVLRRDGTERILHTGFLTDGKDFYLFLEPAEVRVNGYLLSLPAMSYVEAVYTGKIQVFNSGTKEFMIEDPQGIPTASTDSYTVSLLDDTMTGVGGQRILLFSRMDQLDVF